MAIDSYKYVLKPDRGFTCNGSGFVFPSDVISKKVEGDNMLPDPKSLKPNTGEMWKCPNCNQTNLGNESFCFKCGEQNHGNPPQRHTSISSVNSKGRKELNHG